MMCYSGHCAFENYMGDCRVYDFKKFESELGEPACYVGGMPDCPESAEYIESNKERFKELQKLAISKKLAW